MPAWIWDPQIMHLSFLMRRGLIPYLGISFSIFLGSETKQRKHRARYSLTVRYKGHADYGILF
jgi:hypothetical protein